jgi:phosphopantothenoylcysteine decarboxylase/phosphopantothenate--cysteine ligase
MSFIALGVSGGIGAYKAVEIARGLQKEGHDVVAVMTRSARRFVGPLTFEAVTRRPVVTSQWTPGANADIEHVAIASTIDLLLVAPATANVIGKFAHGIADDFLSSLYLATPAPVMIAPAMNTNMFAHPAVRANLAALGARGVRVIEPGEGYLACGWIGKGRLAEPDQVVAAVQAFLRLPQMEQMVQSAGPGPQIAQMTQMEGRLAGTRVLVTAGPTFEDIDPVRYVGNRSSGRMGYALAAEASRRGALVTLVTGPTRIDAPPVDELVRIRSAAEMHGAVMARAGSAAVVIMAAAVADYTPEITEPEKLAKRAGPLSLTLIRTRDILADLGALASRAAGEGPVLVGFAAETRDVVAHAREKLARKGVDLIVANDVSRRDAGFDVETNAVTLVSTGATEEVALTTKTEVAARILDRVERLLESRRAKVADLEN